MAMCMPCPDAGGADTWVPPADGPPVGAEAGVRVDSGAEGGMDADAAVPDVKAGGGSDTGPETSTDASAGVDGSTSCPPSIPSGPCPGYLGRSCVYPYPITVSMLCYCFSTGWSCWG